MSDSAVNQAELSSDRPAWLVHIQGRIEEERDELGSDSVYFEIIRDLLLAPKDDDNAIMNAVNRFYDHYISGFENENRKTPEYAAGHIFNTISCIILETVAEVSFTDYKHDRLAEFLIAIKKEAADKCKPEDPRFVYYGWGLEAAAIDAGTKEFAQEPEINSAEAWLNKAALLAKLFRGGLLDIDGPRWLSGDFERAFETHAFGDVASDLGRQAQVLAPANHVLIAGELLAKEVKTPSQKWPFELNEEKWKLWASKLQEVADAAGEDAEWNLKERAQEAHDKMLELILEAFNVE